MDENKVFLKALDVYGPEHQIIKLLEEMSELQKELCKWLGSGYTFPAPRNDKTEAMRSNICEELADVSIVIAQMLLLFSFDGQAEAIRAAKIERLAERMKDTPMMEGI